MIMGSRPIRLYYSITRSGSGFIFFILFFHSIKNKTSLNHNTWCGFTSRGMVLELWLNSPGILGLILVALLCVILIISSIPASLTHIVQYGKFQLFDLVMEI